MDERTEYVLGWLRECNGLFNDEITEIGQPGDDARIALLATYGLIRFDGAMWVPTLLN